MRTDNKPMSNATPRIEIQYTNKSGELRFYTCPAKALPSHARTITVLGGKVVKVTDL